MSYSEIVTADRRLMILRALAEDPEYSHNDAVLQRMLGAVGHTISADRLRTELRWLEEQGLVGIDPVGGMGMMVARLTQRGEDVARGRTTAPGVARPRPER